MACDVAADEPPAIPTVLELRVLDKAPAVCPVQEPRAPDKSLAVCTARELRAGDAPSAMGRAPDLCAGDTEHAAHDRNASARTGEFCVGHVGVVGWAAGDEDFDSLSQESLFDTRSLSLLEKLYSKSEFVRFRVP
ncbi:uncharacterized protein LOC119269723 [Triticum dicoccoides]|uniref:uncharacterized protein LOC119269723 n=1 Tax=Triticum dicoccoides TaxID=85692 RepID=UPI00188FF652|nr:uncharacterized protein LOC119269723 [Triticum dicoccoides]